MTHQQLDRKIALPPLGDDDTGCDVLHIDMDAFFASVELRDRPELVGKPVIVGGGGGRGVVTSATYEAREFGVHSAMPMSRALRLCPQAVVVDVSHGKYGEASKEVMSILREFSPEVEVVSVDEAFMNVASVRMLHGGSSQIARKIRARVADELDLTCSVGIGRTTSVAKIASTLSKPNGLLLVPANQTVEFMHALPVGRLWGVGDATRKSLDSIGVYSVADLSKVPESALVAAVGKTTASRLRALANGEEVRAVTTSRSERSISSERTFAEDVRSLEVVRAKTREECQTILRRARKAGLLARTVTVKLRFADFETLERSHTLPAPAVSASEVEPTVDRLLAGLWREGNSIRLVGVRLSGLVQQDQVGEQLSLESLTESRNTVERMTDEIAEKFGSEAVKSARNLQNKSQDW